MKKIIFLIIVSCTVLTVKAQRTERIGFATSIGTGITISEPESTPFTWQVLGCYAINKRFSVGAGTGVSIYKKTLVPLFANVKFAMMKPRKFTPYIECGVGYSFILDKNANGGFYLSPSIGMQYSICGSKKLFFALGYELQKLEWIIIQEQSLFTVEFAEKLRYNSISIKIGFIF